MSLKFAIKNICFFTKCEADLFQYVVSEACDAALRITPCFDAILRVFVVIVMIIRMMLRISNTCLNAMNPCLCLSAYIIDHC